MKWRQLQLFSVLWSEVYSSYKGRSGGQCIAVRGGGLTDSV
jgi:hypothetical protein